MQIFANKELAKTFSENSKKKAIITHNKKINSCKMVEIYREIISKNNPE